VTPIRAGGGRFRGVRHSAGWDASEAIGNSRTATGSHLLRQADFQAGLARLTGLAAYWRPYMEISIDRFGPDRCMVESNFPVEKMGISWAVLWHAFKRIAAGASDEEKLALFSGTARRVYRLD
jgi:predicted TIM-barrel fold metal-dependent hydrolase